MLDEQRGLLYQPPDRSARSGSTVVFPAHHAFGPHQYQDRLGGGAPDRCARCPALCCCHHLPDAGADLGATLGIAIVGTVVSSSIAGNLLHRIPTTTAERVALAGALQHGFVAVLVFALIAAFFLKDVLFVPTSGREAESES